jgi:hypothetical protein
MTHYTRVVGDSRQWPWMVGDGQEWSRSTPGHPATSGKGRAESCAVGFRPPPSPIQAAPRACRLHRRQARGHLPGFEPGKNNDAHPRYPLPIWRIPGKDDHARTGSPASLGAIPLAPSGFTHASTGGITYVARGWPFDVVPLIKTAKAQRALSSTGCDSSRMNKLMRFFA